MLLSRSEICSCLNDILHIIIISYHLTGENVIALTAMLVLHQNPELHDHTRKSAEKCKQILRLLKGRDIVADHCMAIVYVCAGVRGEDDLIRVRTLCMQECMLLDDT